METRKDRMSRAIISAIWLSAWLAISFVVSVVSAQSASMTVSAQSASTTKGYAGRLQQAGQVIDELIEQESPAPTVVERMTAIKRLLPPGEEVETDGVVVRVDNSWLHELIDNIIKNADGDIEQRHSTLREIADRLNKLRQQVDGAQNQTVSSSQDQRARLESILARPEYQPDEKRESFLERWVRRLKELILRILARLFGGASALAPGAGLVTVFRILIVLAVFAALPFAAIKLAQHLQARKKPGGKPEAREVLGEEIAQDVSAADLFAKAMELARQGEYRAAIRRAYLALLFELEERDKLRLHRSKTNRDYLNALRSEQQIYPSFSVMTNAFEHVWYGQEWATETEFEDFVTLYRETIK